MIRRSLLIATVAVLLSLGAHLLGLGFAIRIERSPPASESAGETIAVGNAFEEIAEALEEPEAPERAPEPELEQPIEPVPPVSEAEVPDTEVLVASENPQDTYAPDTGTAQIVAPVPLAGTQDDFTPKPDVTEPTSQPNDTDPVPPQTDTAAPLGTETDTADAIAPVAAQTPATPVVPEVTEPVEDEIAALPETVMPVVPVTPLSLPEVEDLVEAVPSERSDEERPEDGSESEPQALFPGLRNGFDDLRNPTQTLESPLETFQREGSLASVGGFGIPSGSAATSRGPGNSDTTNYAGRVLVHLNRTRSVHVKASGFARVFFEINPDGSLNWVEVIDSSGNEAVNRAARTQIQSAVPFPAPPNGTRRQLSFLYSSR
ncbi:energy transducer TonB family protein [Shimia sagamensis]|uniref:Outer membrane transport energization protein TonB n=1 Tax=Shimia sagamensis TaxID=1566352 RepID=A0ABY1PCA7_9RHOB|nr:TonB family protein [Shimia sagamensis]SMP31097.1 outer membrane transport energization protein TonB [Shimia sagamensis]